MRYHTSEVRLKAAHDWAGKRRLLWCLHVLRLARLAGLAGLAGSCAFSDLVPPPGDGFSHGDHD